MNKVMKANELSCKDLMVGDWVRIKMSQHNTKVTNIDANSVYTETAYPIRYDEIEPIPLTAEILEKNGWVYNNEDEKFFPQTWVGGGLMLQGADDCGYRIVVTSDYDDEDTNNTPFVIIYVHELQHALRLRRIKKEIEL